MHPCPVRGCGETEVDDDKLMCLRHWRMVPLTLGQEVVSAFYAMRRAMRGGQAPAYQQLDAIRKYTAARDAAIAHVNDLLEMDQMDRLT